MSGRLWPILGCPARSLIADLSSSSLRSAASILSLAINNQASSRSPRASGDSMNLEGLKVASCVCILRDVTATRQMLLSHRFPCHPEVIEDPAQSSREPHLAVQAAEEQHPLHHSRNHIGPFEVCLERWSPVPGSVSRPCSAEYRHAGEKVNLLSIATVGSTSNVRVN
jgi:hypothetical protein